MKDTLPKRKQMFMNISEASGIQYSCRTEVRQEEKRQIYEVWINLDWVVIMQSIDKKRTWHVISL